jgi:hypothetical protein
MTQGAETARQGATKVKRGGRPWAGTRLVALVAVVLGVALLAWLGVTYARTAAQPRVRGLITDVQTRDIGHAASMTVHATDGRDWQFDVDPSVDMTPGHMREHMAFGQPVTVYYRRTDGRPVAVQVTD